MAFCSKCGAPAGEGAVFCTKCGNRLAVIAPTVPVQPVQQPAYQPAPQPVQPPAPVYAGKNFSNVTVRYRCPNGDVFDGTEQQTACPKCGAPLAKGGYIQMYRMGNYMGSAVGMGVYIDDVPCGHIANKQSIRISVPFGSHKVHVTHTTTRKCNDPVFTVTPQAPYVWCKAHFSKGGFAIAVEPANPQDMPEV